LRRAESRIEIGFCWRQKRLHCGAFFISITLT
jgi:hypothetical protein